MQHVRAARPAAPLASSAARWRTPKRCCSSTTATAEPRRTATGSSISAWVPTISDSSPLRELAEEVGAARRRRRPGEQPDRHQLAGQQRLDRGEVLLGERLGRRHQRPLVARARPRAAARTARPRSCPSRPRPSAAAASAGCRRGRASISSSARCWSPVSGNGSSSASQRAVSSRAPSSTGAPRRGRRSRRRRRSASWASSSSSKASRRRAAPARSSAREVRGRQRAAAVGQALARRAAAPAAARRRRRARRVLAHEREDLGRGQALGGRVVRDGASPPPAAAAAGRRVGLHAEAVAGLELAVQDQPGARPGTCCTSHGWLKNVAFIVPVASATVASTSGRMPRRRTGREAMLRTSTTTVAVSPGTSSAIARASRRSRGRCSSRSPTVCSPSARPRPAALAPSSAQRRASREGRG